MGLRADCPNSGVIVDGALLQAELIETYEHGWVMVNDTHASVLLMRKNSCG